MAYIYVVLFGIFAVVSAISDIERTAIRLAVLPTLVACGAELGVTKEQAAKAKETKDPDILDPCFYACFFKKTGIINDNGVYDPAVILEKHKKYVHGEEDLKKIESMAHECTSVNEKSVGDGTKGCERAKLLVHCLMEQKSLFTPVLEQD